MNRRLQARRAKALLGGAPLILLAVVGALLITDQPGLETEYFALGAPWERPPFHTGIGEPSLEDSSAIREVLSTEVIYSVRWQGWWRVSEEGEHHFAIKADDGGYLRIDDDLVVDTRGTFGERREAGRKALAAGFHRIEIGHYQTHGESRLAVQWLAPALATTVPIPPPMALRVADLYAGRPLSLRRVIRGGLESWPRVYRRLLGALSLLVVVLLLQPAKRFGRPVDRLCERLRSWDGPRFRAALLLALFGITFLAVLPLTGTVRGGDDTAYLSAAHFSAKQWFFNRYAHVYMLKLFTTVSGGDPLTGVRVWWSFVFATTVAALAVAVRSIGPGLQLRTLAVTLFVLFSQTSLLGLIGAGFADYSAMLFVTLAVAVHLHGSARERERPPPEPDAGRRHEWHALAIGMLTVAAFRSKEVGAVLLVLPLLFLIGDGRLDLRRFARKMAYWLGGALSVLMALFLLDAWILGDFFFTVREGRLGKSERMNFPLQMAPRKTTESWLHTIWTARHHAINASMRNLWLAVSAAALVAGVRRRRLGLRLLHLIPMAYLGALVLLYVRMPHPFSARMLTPIVPVACLTAGLLLHHVGLDRVRWHKFLSPAVLVPAGVAAALLTLVAIPYRLGTLEAANFLPMTFLSRYGWDPDHFVIGVLLPAVLLAACGGLALIARRRRARVAALLLSYVALFGVGFALNHESLSQRRAVQNGELLTYPWRAFRDEINAVPDSRIALSRDLEWRYEMSATTRTSLARLALQRQDIRVVLTAELPTNADLAIASRYAYSMWQRQRPDLVPALEATATWDPAGALVLVRPKEALAQTTRPRKAP